MTETEDGIDHQSRPEVEMPSMADDRWWKG